MKKRKFMTVLIPIVLILVIAMIGVCAIVYEKYSYSKELANMEGYFGDVTVEEYTKLKEANIEAELIDESFAEFEAEVDAIVPITLGVERIEEKAIKLGDYYYLQ